VVGTRGAGRGDVVERHLDRVGRVGEVDHVGASHVPGGDGGLRDAEQPPWRKSSRQFAIAVCETPSRRAASATPVGGVAEARPPADGPCETRGCREPDERGDGGDGAGRWTPVGSVLVRLALDDRRECCPSFASRAWSARRLRANARHADTSVGVPRAGLRRAQRPRPSAVRNSGRGLQPDWVTRNARISDPLNQTGCRTRRCPDWAR
jgi:hypothetical protein